MKNYKLKIEIWFVAIINGKATFKIFVIEGGKKNSKTANCDYKEIELRKGDDIKLIKVIKTWR